MKHDLCIEGPAYRLRPVDVADADFIMRLRSGDPVRMRYLHPVSTDVKLQIDWIMKYLQRPDDYYWIIESVHSRRQEGLIGIYNMDGVRRCAEWGRWALISGSFAAAESVLLLFRIAYGPLGLDQLYSLTVQENQNVLSFHDSCGFRRAEVIPDAFQLNDGAHAAVKHVCDRAEWPSIERQLEAHVWQVARRLEAKP